MLAKPKQSTIYGRSCVCNWFMFDVCPNTQFPTSRSTLHTSARDQQQLVLASKCFQMLNSPGKFNEQWILMETNIRDMRNVTLCAYLPFCCSFPIKYSTVFIVAVCFVSFLAIINFGVLCAPPLEWLFRHTRFWLNNFNALAKNNRPNYACKHITCDCESYWSASGIKQYYDCHACEEIPTTCDYLPICSYQLISRH